MDRNDPLLHQICGKVQALELLAEFVLRDWATRGNADDPVGEIAQIRKRMFSTLQFVDHQESAFAEAVWQETVDALDRMISNAREQLEAQARRRPPST